MRVFISYASEERDTAEEIHLALVGAGHETFFDKNSLPPGGDYHARIARAVAACDAFVFLISAQSIARGSYALTELKHARAKWAHGKGHVLPVMVHAVPFESLPNYLGAVTVLEPEGNTAAEVALALADLEPPDERETPEESETSETEPDDTGARPRTTPTAAILDVKHAHNLIVQSPMGPSPGMSITIDADVRGAARRTLQLLVRFAYFNGPPLRANPSELVFRDAQGLVATGTPPRVLASDNESLRGEIVTIPYYALNFQPMGGMGAYNLTLTAFVVLNQQPAAQLTPAPFGLRW